MTKKEAMAIVFSCADEYKENLVGRSLLFLCQDKHKRTYCLEVTFNSSNFQHLTGFKTKEAADNTDVFENVMPKKKIDAAHFLELCLDRRLTEDDFDFAEDGTTPLKMCVLPRAVKKNLSANMVGYYNGHQPRLYTERLAGSVQGCVGFVKDKDIGRYVPNTLLEGDVRLKIAQPDRILATYRKRSEEEAYSEIVYAAKKVEWEKVPIPTEYSYLPLPVARSDSDGIGKERNAVEGAIEALPTSAENKISGEMRKARETAINLYEMKMDIELIAKAVGIDIELVERWIELGDE